MKKNIKCSPELESLLDRHPLLSQAKLMAKALKRATDAQHQGAIPLMKAQGIACKTLGFDSLHALRQRCLADFSPQATCGNAFSFKSLSSHNAQPSWELGSAASGFLNIAPSHLAGHLLHIGGSADGSSLHERIAMQAIHSSMPSVWINGSGDRAASTRLHQCAISAGRGGDVRRIVFDWDGLAAPGDDGLPRHSFSESLTGSAAALTSTFADMLFPDDGHSSNHSSMWAGRAISMLSAVLLALTHLRDQHGIRLTFASIQAAITLGSIEDMHGDPRMAPHVAQSLRAYLSGLPGYRFRPAAISEIPMHQHGYLQMQVARGLATLSSHCGFAIHDDPSSIQLPELGADPSIIAIVDLPPPSERPQHGQTLSAAMCSGLSSTIASRSELRISSGSPHLASATPILMIQPFLPAKFTAALAQAKSAGFFAAIEFDTWQTMDLHCSDPSSLRDACAVLAADRPGIAHAIAHGWLLPSLALTLSIPSEEALPRFRRAFCSGGQAAFSA